jgi:hypothetical protein
MLLRARLVVLLAAVLAPAVARAADVGEACKSDGECVVGTFCGETNVCQKLERTKNVIPFYFHRPGEYGHRHIPILLYFSTWDKHEANRVQLPLVIRHTNKDTQTSTTVFPLLFTSAVETPEATKFRIWPFVFGAKYRPYGGQAAIIPLFWWSHDHDKHWVVIPPLLSGGKRDDKEDLTEGVFALAGYYRQHGDDTWRVLFPVLWEHEKGKDRTLVAPLIWSHSDGERHATVIFPFIWESADPSRQLSQIYILPVFGHRSDDKRTVDVFAPLFTHWKTRDDYSRGIIFLPFAWARDPAGSTTTLFPIYWRFHDNAREATSQLLFPIAGYHTHRGAAGGFIGPVYGWRSHNGSGGWGAGIAPILMFGKNGARSHALVLPIFARTHDADAGTTTTAVGPLYVRTTPDGGDGGVFPIVFAGRHGDDSYATVPPIYWHKGDASGATDVVGPLYVKHGERGWAFGLAPLLFAGNLDGKSHQVVFPIFWHWSDPRNNASRLVVGPYYHRRDGDETADVFFPLLYLRKSPDDGFGLWPIGGWVREKGVDTTVIFPFAYQTNRDKHSRTSMFFPLLTIHDSPSWSVKVFFPIIWRVRDRDETNTAVIPFYLGGRGPGFDWDATFPFFVQTRTSIARTTVFGPIWYRKRKDGGGTTGIFPLFAWGKKVEGDKSGFWFGMPGLYVDDSKITGKGHFWTLNIFRSHDDKGYKAGFIPLMFAWRRGTASKVLTPIYYRQADSARDYSLDVFTLFYWGHEGPRAKQFGFFPLVMEKTHADGTWWAEVFPFFAAVHRNDGATVLTLLGGYRRDALGSRAYIGPFYWRNDRKQKTFAIFPIAYFGHNKESDRTTSLVLPLYFDTRAADGKEVQAYTPAIWRFKTVESSTTIGLPLFFDVNRFAESRTTALLPIVMRNRTEIDKSTAYTLPFLLTWWKSPDGARRNSDFVVFPIVWRYYGGPERTTNIVAPFVWDFRRGGARTTIVFPIAARWKRPEWDNYLFPLVYYKKGLGVKTGSWYVNVFPLVTVGRPRKKDLEWYFLEGLFGYSRTGRNRNLRLFWVLDFQLQPLRANELSGILGSTPPEARELF